MQKGGITSVKRSRSDGLHCITCYCKVEKKMAYKVSVVVEKDEHGFFAYCPELEGCHSQGDSLEEVLDNVKEAIELYLETLPEEERSERLSHEIFTTAIEVKVA